MPTVDITENDGRIQYTATAGQTEFVYDFIIFDEADIVVNQNGTNLTLTTDYTVSGVDSESGGTVTLVTGATLNDTITLERSSTISRDSQYQVDGRLDAAPLERDMDRIFTILQEQDRDIGRATTLPLASSLTNVELPTPASSQLIGWNTAADGLSNYSFSILTADIDTVFTGLSANDFLQYDGTNWVNVSSINTTNIDALTTAGGSLRSSNNNVCISFGGGGSANSTLGGNMSGASAYKLTNMIDPTSAQDYATKAYVDANGTGMEHPSYQSGGYYTTPLGINEGSLTVSANRLYGMAFYVHEDTTFDGIGVQVSTLSAGNARMGIYSMDADLSGTLVLDAGTVSTGTTGEKLIAISQALTKGWYWLAITFDATPDVLAFSMISAYQHFFPVSSIGAGSAVGVFDDVTYGALPSSYDHDSTTGSIPRLFLTVA